MSSLSNKWEPFFWYIYVYIRTYVRTFLIRVRVLVICDRNSIARKREEFPILVAEVASSVELSITITKIQVFLVRPDNMPRSTHKCLNIYYRGWRASEASETLSGLFNRELR